MSKTTLRSSLHFSPLLSSCRRRRFRQVLVGLNSAQLQFNLNLLSRHLSSLISTRARRRFDLFRAPVESRAESNRASVALREKAKKSGRKTFSPRCRAHNRKSEVRRKNKKKRKLEVESWKQQVVEIEKPIKLTFSVGAWRNS